MSFFDHLCDLLESDAPLPPASRIRLRDAFRRIAAGMDPIKALGLAAHDAQADRNSIIRTHVVELPARTLHGRCRLLAAEVQRLHRGRRTVYPWIAQADRIRRLPESWRQYANILK